jgi:YYY domain-containing protein
MNAQPSATPLETTPPAPGSDTAQPPRSGSSSPRQDTHRNPVLVIELLLALVLIAGFALRLRGIYWGEFTYMHPDERFLVWVGTDIQPIGSETLGAPPTASQPGLAWRGQFPDVFADCQDWGGYFDASCSSLNPHNRGHAFYVYGTLPMFLTRYVVEWVYGHSGFTEMTKVGRPLSAAADLLLVLLVYLAGARMFNERVGVLAAAFSALAVLQIQQSHFFTMDTFITLFTMLALYFALRISLENSSNEAPESGPHSNGSNRAGVWQSFFKHPNFWLSIGFGIALGMAVASKLNAVLVAWTLPAAMLVSFLTLPPEERVQKWERWLLRTAGYLALAAFLSFLTFRVFQPYAFSGPGFFGLKPNPMWMANIRELMAQGAGDVDFPPSLQWARRTIFFSGKNLSLYGLGLPLAILAWAGFLWSGWRLLHGEWRRHILLWSWTAFYFGWQSLAFNPTMRYQLPVYPTLALFAAWGVIELYERGRIGSLPRWVRPSAVIIAAAVLLLTLGWAIGFTNIYDRPFTRVEASRWIYQNIPGPINLHIETDDGVYNQIIPYPYDFPARPDNPFQVSITAKRNGTVREIYMPHVADLLGETTPYQLRLTISALPGGESPLESAFIVTTPIPGGHNYILTPNRTISIPAEQELYLTLVQEGFDPSLTLCGTIALKLQTLTGFVEQTLEIPGGCAPASLSLPFSSSSSGFLTQLVMAEVIPPDAGLRNPTTVTVSLAPNNGSGEMYTASLSSLFKPDGQGRGQEYSLLFEQPFTVEEGQTYLFEFTVQPGGGTLTIEGSAIANEGDWDDGLPLRIDAYDGYGGIYRRGLNFNMYTQENTEKLERFLSILDQAEYISISSNRQWGSLPRLPERFPLSTTYYRSLLGCPAARDIFWCYATAEPALAQEGFFQGSLGFELVYVAQSNPSLGPIEINDQFAEEAFHVYDHPKVLIFKKTEKYSPETARAILASVDLDRVVHITPKRAGPFPADLMLPADRLAEQRSGGTWSELFNPEALHNQYQVLGVVSWYLAIWVIGLLVYPALRIAMPGLSDRGYPMSRIAGLLVLSYIVWVAGSLRIPATRLTIGAALLLMAGACALMVYFQRDELRAEWKEKRRYFLVIEGLFLGLFLLFLLVRWGNPDLWHPWKGGEKPMDFAYFNAILKSTSFPPYDPWFAGGYLNYYYYGFIIAGVPVKLLGIVPAFAYNLILPSIFAMTALGAFSIGWNLARGNRWIPGLAAASGMAVLGNLGTLRMIFRGYQMLVDPKFAQEGPGFFARLAATFQGFGRVLSGQTLPYNIGDWYWIPSRVMPPGDNAITEFPMFTFLYADPHAHLFALPVTLLCLAGALAIVLGRARWRSPGAGFLCIALLALAIGALWPTNTWDYPTYLALGIVAIFYTFLRYHPVHPGTFSQSRFLSPLASLPTWSKRLLLAGAPAVLLIVLAQNFYFSYYQWFGQGYSSIQPWKGPLTPLNAYFTHWGLFLFIAITWMIHESVVWMAKTPLSALRKLDRYWEVIYVTLALLLAAVAALAIKLPLPEPIVVGNIPLGRGVVVAVIAIPLAAWAGVLLLRPNLPDAKRVVLFLIGTALIITLVVEMIELRGDINRQNTVFKLYLQAWTLFAVSAAAALAWLLGDILTWPFTSRAAFQTGLIFMTASVALFPLLGGAAKIQDRMTNHAPHTLDGMAFMQYARYNESGYDMDLSQDYRAIRWMQENVQGSPVIVEANSGNLYRWYLRFSIYTGLPSVVGWEWHQQQQRALTPPDWVSRRLWAINEFYTTESVEVAEKFLAQYNVRYIVLGQLEKATYPGPGLEKFDAQRGLLWQEVYRDQETILYEVTAP